MMTGARYPRITADLIKLRKNVDRCADLCHRRGMTLAAVTKCFCAEPRIVSMLSDSSCDMLADSRLENLRTLPTNKPRFLIRSTQSWEIPEVIRWADISLQSEEAVITQLGEEAARQGKRHKIVLACDLGDLREGCFFQDEADIHRTAEATLAKPMLELFGVGMNLGCFGGVLPCEENMSGLCAIADKLRKRYGIPLPLVSGGSSNMIHHLLAGSVPAGINNARIGGLWLTGHDPGLGMDIEGFYNDAIRFSAQLVEVKEKPSKPIGPIGGDAFGIVRERPDLGPMRRGILACGKQDMDLDGMIPLDTRVHILGGSSDHTLLDLTEAPEYTPGDTLTFRLNYAAVMRGFTSRYVYKEIV